MSSGKIAQVIGPVVDVLFAAGETLPEINNALVVYKKWRKKKQNRPWSSLELGDGMVHWSPWNQQMVWLVEWKFWTQAVQSLCQ